MKVQGHSFLEPAMEYNQDQTTFTNQVLPSCKLYSYTAEYYAVLD